MDIVAAGYGWTGSGAIIAMLRSQPNIKMLPGGELQLIKYSGGLSTLAKVYSKLGFIDADAQSRAARVLLGKPLKDEPQGARLRRNTGKFLDDHGDAYRNLVLEFLSQLGELSRHPGIWFDRNVFRSMLSNFIQNFLNLYREPGVRLILDQAVKVVDISPLAYLDAKMVIVDRDPRDSFYDRQLHQMVNRPTLDVYVGNLAQRRQKTQAALTKKAELAKRVRLVRFEEFVLSADFRRELCRWLDIDSPILDGGYFHPERSAENIGIHKRASDQAPYEKIAELFPDELWK